MVEGSERIIVRPARRFRFLRDKKQVAKYRREFVEEGKTLEAKIAKLVEEQMQLQEDLEKLVELDGESFYVDPLQAFIEKIEEQENGAGAGHTRH